MRIMTKEPNYFLKVQKYNIVNSDQYMQISLSMAIGLNPRAWAGPVQASGTVSAKWASPNELVGGSGLGCNSRFLVPAWTAF